MLVARWPTFCSQHSWTKSRFRMFSNIDILYLSRFFTLFQVKRPQELIYIVISDVVGIFASENGVLLDGTMLKASQAFAAEASVLKAVAAEFAEENLAEQFPAEEVELMRSVCGVRQLASFADANECRASSATMAQEFIVIGRSYYYEKDGDDDKNITVHAFDGRSAFILSIWNDCVEQFKDLMVEGAELIIYRGVPLPRKSQSTCKFAFNMCCRSKFTHIETIADAAAATAAANAASLVAITATGATELCLSMPDIEVLTDGYELTSIAALLDKNSNVKLKNTVCL